MLVCLMTICGGFLLTIISMFAFGEERVLGFFNAKTTKSLIALAAGIVMYYTPDEIDKIIMAILSIFEITPVSIDLLKKGINKLD